MIINICIFNLATQRNGSGKLVSKIEGTYEGSWEDDLRHGAGKLTYPNGDTYEGGWERNKVMQYSFLYSVLCINLWAETCSMHLLAIFLLCCSKSEWGIANKVSISNRHQDQAPLCLEVLKVLGHSISIKYRLLTEGEATKCEVCNILVLWHVRSLNNNFGSPEHSPLISASLC